MRFLTINPSLGSSHGVRHASHQRQQGVVLFIALILLVAMTMIGIALIRSTSTSNLVAGNLAFRQAATNAGDVGAEIAFQWLVSQANTSPNTLLTKPLATAEGNFYSPFVLANVSDAKYRGIPDLVDPALPRDIGGNTVSYTIERLCENLTGQVPVEGAQYLPNTDDAACVRSPMVSAGNEAGQLQVLMPSNVYYRVTVRINGPRNTQTYLQTVVSL